LLEVLVAVFVLSVGLLGLAGLHAASIKSNHSAYYRFQATSLGDEIIDRMRVNAKAARAGKYNVDLGADFSSTDAIATQDMSDWTTHLAVLPSVDRSIDCDASGNCKVVVQWDDSRPEQDLGAAGSTRKANSSALQFSVVTRI
jgi:type IV pilus assembly protein PilV